MTETLIDNCSRYFVIARVTLNPATTALLVLDYVEPICDSQPKCKGGMLSAVIPFMARARKAGVIVGYGTREQNMSKWLPQVAPTPGDIKVVSTAQDRIGIAFQAVRILFSLQVNLQPDAVRIALVQRAELMLAHLLEAAGPS